MHWILGIDFTGRCNGALQMAAWLHREAQAEAQEVIGIHVLPERLRRVLVNEATAAAPSAAIDDVHRLVQASGVPLSLAEVRAPWAATAEEGLALAAAMPNVTGILIGRATTSDTRGLHRLGRVARRLLRSLPAPVMIVPPDVELANIGKGPIVLATDLDPASAGAAQTARSLGTALDRELLVVSVDAEFQETARHAPESLLTREIPRRSGAELRKWMETHALAGERTRLAEGERVTTLLAVAKESDSPLIVCGSRRLSLLERLFASSTATALARTSDCAVLVVPPA